MEESEIHKKQQDLTLVVEPLVDSISELILSSVTGNFANVQTSCMNIADRTNKLVIIAQQVATSSTDSDLQLEVAGAINLLASSIEKLVVSFTVLLGSSNPDSQYAFAEAAKEVGEAINKLVQSTDATSQQKIITAVTECRDSAKRVENSALRQRDDLLASAQLCVDKTVRLVKVATIAASSTADEKKKSLLLEGAQKVKIGGPALIQAAKTVIEKPHEVSAKNELSARYQDLNRAFEALENAAKISPLYFAKVDETFEYVKKLIEAARQLEEAATNLYTVTKTGTAQQFLETAKGTAQKALALVEQAEGAIRVEKDPIKKQLMKDAVLELREASQAMISAAKAYRENPNDPATKAKFEEAHIRLENAIKRVVQATKGELIEDTPKGKLVASSFALESIANEIMLHAQHNPKELVQDAEILTAIAMQVVKDIETYAAGVQDPNLKKKLLAEAADVKAASQRVAIAARKVAANPNDKAAQKELADAHHALLDKINAVRRDARLSPELERATIELDTASGKSGEAQLVQAAKEQAASALQLAEEAGKLASKIPDAAKRQKLQAAINEVKVCSQKVIEAAEIVALKPEDPVAQQKLANAQKDLGNAIQKVVDLTDEKDAELTDAMADVKSGSASGGREGVVLDAAQAMLDEIAKTFGTSGSMKPEEVIANAKNLSAKANELAKQLRELADKTTDPVFKEKLINAAKIIRDSAIQVKILSAVRAAGGEDKSNSVGMAIKGLQTNISEVMKEVKSESIRNKFKSTVKTTIAINKVVNIWRAKNKK